MSKILYFFISCINYLVCSCVIRSVDFRSFSQWTIQNTTSKEMFSWRYGYVNILLGMSYKIVFPIVCLENNLIFNYTSFCSSKRLVSLFNLMFDWINADDDLYNFSLCFIFHVFYSARITVQTNCMQQGEKNRVELTVSVVFSSRCPSRNHVITAGGLEPALWHSKSYRLPADNGWCAPNKRIFNGVTT